MKDKQKIILEVILEGKTQRQIARDMKISRTTIAKYINNHEASKSKLMGCDDPYHLLQPKIPPSFGFLSQSFVSFIL